MSTPKTSTIDVGANGQWQVVVSQGGQDYSRNVTSIHVQCYMINKGSYASYNNNNIGKSLYGAYSWSGAGPFNVPAGGSLLFIDQWFEVTHDANGYCSVDVGATLGATGTTTFGSGGSTAVIGFQPDRIPQLPKPPTVAVSSIGMTSAVLSATQGDNMGSEITTENYRVHRASDGAWMGDIQGGDAGVTFTNLDHNTGYVAYAQSENGRGWGGWSAGVGFNTLPQRPSPPGQPTFSEALPTSVRVSWAPSADNGGSPILGYLLRVYPSTGGYYDFSFENNTSRVVTGLTPGATYTFVVFAQTAAADNGGYSNQSPTNTIQMLAGVWIKVAGVWKMAVPYVKVAGVWKMAQPYIKSGGVWKMTN